MAYSAFPVVAAIIGFLALYFAFFVYEDEMGRLRDRVDHFWVRIGQARKSGTGIVLAFFNTLAQALNTGFDRLLGRELLSWRCFGVAVSYSLFGFWLGASLLIENDNKKLVAVQVALGLLALFCGSAPALFKVQSMTIVSLCPSLATPAIALTFSRFAPFPALFVVNVLIAILIADFVLIALGRVLFRRIGSSRNWFVVFFIMTLQIFLAAVLFSAPFLAALYMERSAMTVVADVVAEVVTYLNFFTELVFLALIGLVPLLLWQRLLWPILREVRDLAARYRIVRKPMAMGAIGLTFLLGAFLSQRWITALGRL